jgi:hypothetical protein
LPKDKGDYVQYLDADDRYRFTTIAGQVKRLESEQSEPTNTVGMCRWARFYNDDATTAKFVEHLDCCSYPRARRVV